MAVLPTGAPKLLPKNERKVPKETPRNFLIYGAAMHGKTFFADEFPNPLNLNTDGNAEMIETPSLNIQNIRGRDGSITQSAFDYLGEILNELENTNHTFETLIIDVMDDIVALFEQEIIEEAGVKSIGDIGFGKGYKTHESMIRAFVMKLKGMSMTRKINVIYTSRLTTIEENNVTRYLPSLPQKWMNIVNGNSDYTILCQKMGKNYIRRVESKRKNYTREMVDDDKIKSLLDTVVGAYDKSKKTSIDEAKKIVSEQETVEAEKVAEPVEQTEPSKAEETKPTTVPKSTPEAEIATEPVTEDKPAAPVTPPRREAPKQEAAETPTTRTARPAPRPPRN